MTPLQQAEIYEKWAKTIRMCEEHGIEPYCIYGESWKCTANGFTFDSDIYVGKRY